MDLSVGTESDLGQLMKAAADRGRHISQASLEGHDSPAADTTGRRCRRRLTIDITEALLNKARRSTRVNGDLGLTQDLVFDSSIASDVSDLSEPSAEQRARSFLESGCGGLSLLDATRLLEDLRSPQGRCTRRGTRRLPVSTADDQLAQLGEDGIRALLHLVDEQLDSFKGSLSDVEDEPSTNETVVEAERTVVSSALDMSTQENLDPKDKNKPKSKRTKGERTSDSSIVNNSVLRNVTNNSTRRSTQENFTNNIVDSELSDTQNRSIVAGSLEMTRRTGLGSTRASLHLSSAVPLLQSTPRRSQAASDYSLQLELSATTDESAENSVRAGVSQTYTSSTPETGAEVLTSTLTYVKGNDETRGMDVDNSNSRLSASRMEPDSTLSPEDLMSETDVAVKKRQKSQNRKHPVRKPTTKEIQKSENMSLSTIADSTDPPENNASCGCSSRRPVRKPHGNKTATLDETLPNQRMHSCPEASSVTSSAAKFRRRTADLTAALLRKVREDTHLSKDALHATFDGSCVSNLSEPSDEQRARSFLESGCGGLSLLDATRLLEGLRSPQGRRTRRGTRRLPVSAADDQLAQLGEDGVRALLHLVDEQLDSFRGSLSASEDEDSADETVVEADATLTLNQEKVAIDGFTEQNGNNEVVEVQAFSDSKKLKPEATNYEESRPENYNRKVNGTLDLESHNENKADFAVPETVDKLDNAHKTTGIHCADVTWSEEQSRSILAGSLDQTGRVRLNSPRPSLRLSSGAPLLHSTRLYSPTATDISLRLETSLAATDTSTVNLTNASAMALVSPVATPTSRQGDEKKRADGSWKNDTMEVKRGTNVQTFRAEGRSRLEEDKRCFGQDDAKTYGSYNHSKELNGQPEDRQIPSTIADAVREVCSKVGDISLSETDLPSKVSPSKALKERVTTLQENDHSVRGLKWAMRSQSDGEVTSSGVTANIEPAKSYLNDVSATSSQFSGSRRVADCAATLLQTTKNKTKSSLEPLSSAVDDPSSSKITAEQRARSFLERGCDGLSLLEVTHLLEDVRSSKGRCTRQGRRLVSEIDSRLSQLGDGLRALQHLVDEQLDSFRGSLSDSEDETLMDETMVEGEKSNAEPLMQQTLSANPWEQSEKRPHRKVSVVKCAADSTTLESGVSKLNIRSKDEVDVSTTADTWSGRQSRSIVAGSLDQTTRSRLPSPRASLHLSSAMPLLQSTPRQSNVGSEFSLRLESSSVATEASAGSAISGYQSASQSEMEVFEDAMDAMPTVADPVLSKVTPLSSPDLSSCQTSLSSAVGVSKEHTPATDNAPVVVSSNTDTTSGSYGAVDCFSFRAPQFRSSPTADNSLTAVSAVSIRPQSRDSTMTRPLPCELSLAVNLDASERIRLPRVSRLAPPVASFLGGPVLEEEEKETQEQNVNAEEAGAKKESDDGQPMSARAAIINSSTNTLGDAEANNVEKSSSETVRSPKFGSCGSYVSAAIDKTSQAFANATSNASVLDNDVSAAAKLPLPRNPKHRSSHSKLSVCGDLTSSLNQDVNDVGLPTRPSLSLFDNVTEGDRPMRRKARGGAASLSSSFGNSALSRMANFVNHESSCFPDQTRRSHNSRNQNKFDAVCPADADDAAGVTRSRQLKCHHVSDGMAKRSGLSLILDDSQDSEEDDEPVPTLSRSRKQKSAYESRSHHPSESERSQSGHRSGNQSRSSRGSGDHSRSSRKSRNLSLGSNRSGVFRRGRSNCRSRPSLQTDDESFCRGSSNGSRSSKESNGRNQSGSSRTCGDQSRQKLFAVDELSDLDETLVGDLGARSETPSDQPRDRNHRAKCNPGLLDDSSLSDLGLPDLGPLDDPTQLSVLGDPLASSSLFRELTGNLDESDFTDDEEQPPAEHPPRRGGHKPTLQERYAALMTKGAAAPTATAATAPAHPARRVKKRPVYCARVRLFTESDAAHKRWVRTNSAGLKFPGDALNEFVSALSEYEELVMSQLSELLQGRQKVTTADVMELLRRSGTASSPQEVRRLVRELLPLEVQQELIVVAMADGGQYPVEDPLAEL